jgi:hypothetical protein
MSTTDYRRADNEKIDPEQNANAHRRIKPFLHFFTGKSDRAVNLHNLKDISTQNVACFLFFDALKIPRHRTQFFLLIKLIFLFFYCCFNYLLFYQSIVGLLIRSFKMQFLLLNDLLGLKYASVK